MQPSQLADFFQSLSKPLLTSLKLLKLILWISWWNKPCLCAGLSLHFCLSQQTMFFSSCLTWTP